MGAAFGYDCHWMSPFDSRPWRVVVVLCAVGACQKRDVSLERRPCRDSRCLAGSVCHPETLECAPPVNADCDGADGYCPSRVKSGDACRELGGFLPCVDGRDDCAGGCRTCQVPGVWSSCSPPTCMPGQLWSCAGCGNDCRRTVQNAVPRCDASMVPSSCGYDGDCLGGAVDVDADPENGCECAPTQGGLEVCDGADNDCDGASDDGDLCGPGAACLDGQCGPCTAADPQRCGSSCEVCTLSEPTCSAGGCRCNNSSCGSAKFCGDDGRCHVCGDDDVIHCGAACSICGGAIPACVLGSCVCVPDSSPNGSCGIDRYCAANGSCITCSSVDHCGPNCDSCSGSLPVCGAGGCECEAGSCPAGEYCASGRCAKCQCPALFPACTDVGGDARVCRCTASSCPNGSCMASGTVCELVDDCEDATGLLSVCTATDDNRVTNSSWERGTPSGSGNPGCAAGSGCWATDLSGAYNYCELSCLRSVPLDLGGVTGAVDVSFWAWHHLDRGDDGVTPRLRGQSGWQWVPSAPQPPFDTAAAGFATCGWGFSPTWAAWGNYGATYGARPWAEYRLHLASDTSPDFFFDGFEWRVYLESDSTTAYNLGWYLDSVKVRVTEAP
ncbi:MAG: hypothetical protein HY903_02735 [Deltaproteobacteria bacterium]|nr:hypothetical protein [Deltaproteobacteria bacterium]